MGTIGMGLFRPIVFPKLAGKEPDLETARATWREKLPPYLDYLEATLGGAKFFIGDALSIADIAIVCPLTNLEVVAGRPDSGRWPNVNGFLDRVTARESLVANLAVCRKIVGEPYDLS